jgi:predicted RNA-binding protein associated with RNAse of E/G family
MTTPQLYRRRFIPNELVYLKDDIILVLEEHLIITKWDTLHPRSDISRGVSAYYLDKGIKVSKIYDRKDQVVYWYCDIIQFKKNEKENTVIIEDLLIDVILYEDGTMRIVDIDELCDALEQGIITQAEVTYALRTLDHLLKLIYKGHFEQLKAMVNHAEEAAAL